jgi:glyoxylase-like metal-dependent hydrolase (beta-lactamase superfamily II)
MTRPLGVTVKMPVSRAWLKLSTTRDTFDSDTHVFRSAEGQDLKVTLGGRIEVKWLDGHTTGHEVIYVPGSRDMGVAVDHHGSRAYVFLVSVDIQVRLIPPGKPYLKGLKPKTGLR